METILGAVIALVGVAGAQWWLARREDARTVRDEKRERDRQTYEHRRAAYVEFLQVMHEVGWRRTERGRFILGEDDPDKLADEMILPILLPVEIYGSQDVFNAAAIACEEAAQIVYGVDEVMRLRGDVDEMIRLVRLDLGVD